jgi:nucleotide-binding universal stress UspA family protein
MHVLQPIQPIYGISPYPGFMTFRSEVYEKAATENIRRDLCRLIECRVPPRIHACPLVEVGNAADKIVQTAGQEDIDLIVMAAHGLSGWRQRLSGSVAERVLRLAHCPVLTVQRPADDAAEIDESDAEMPQEGARPCFH